MSFGFHRSGAGLLLAVWAAAPSGCASQERATGPLHMGTAWTAAVDDHNWDEERQARPTDASDAAKQSDNQESETHAFERHDDDKPWHLDFAWRGSYTKLRGTKQQLDRRLDLPLQSDFLHIFDEPYTPLDRRSDLGLTTWYVGVGRQESSRFVWTWYAGGGAGQDLNHQKVLNASLEVDFRYGYYYTGMMGEFYPWKVPSVAPGTPWWDRLACSRPFLHAGLETGYVSAEGEGDYKLGGMLIYHDEQKVRDWLTSISVGTGWSFPLSSHWSLNLMGGYSFHFYRPEEYNGWNWTTALRYTF